VLVTEDNAPVILPGRSEKVTEKTRRLSAPSPMCVQVQFLLLASGRGSTSRISPVNRLSQIYSVEMNRLFFAF